MQEKLEKLAQIGPLRIEVRSKPDGGAMFTIETWRKITSASGADATVKCTGAGSDFSAAIEATQNNFKDNFLQFEKDMKKAKKELGL